MTNSEIVWVRTEFEGYSIIRPRGELNALNYRNFGDDLVRFAIEEPRAVIVPVDDLAIPSDLSLTAFSSARMRTGTWPAVPILLVVEEAGMRARFRSSAIDRVVPVFATLAAAVAGVIATPPRRHAGLRLTRAPPSGRRARRFVEEVCERWAVPEVCPDGALVATELVENSLIHADSDDDIGLRLELSRGTFTVAVSDSDPRVAMLREPAPGSEPPGSLHIVARLALAWGCIPRWPLGKVVWASLPIARA
ncbi:ATP-binding protein [Nocardia thraciensis]